RAILADVRSRGDEAVLDYTRKFDRVAARSLAELEVPREKLQQALESLPREQAGALREAGERIRDFHRRQLQSSWEDTDPDGTRSVPRVDKIVGPGNVYVAEAKRQVFGQVGIDMVAGPSEILVIADGRTPADWLAMDLFSQAEHDEAAQALLLSPQASYLDQVELSMKKLLPAMPRREIIAASLQARGALIETRDLEEACALANRIAPEHLELS